MAIVAAAAGAAGAPATSEAHNCRLLRIAPLHLLLSGQSLIQRATGREQVLPHSGRVQLEEDVPIASTRTITHAQIALSAAPPPRCERAIRLARRGTVVHRRR